MLKRNIIILLLGSLLCSTGALLFAQDTIIGGNVKFKVYDNPFGTHNGVKGHEYIGIGLGGMYLYFYKELTEKISVDLQPNWSTSTGATPKFGSNIGAGSTAAADVEPEFHGWTKAVITAQLPGNYELSFGIVKPLFSWDYGHELFWAEETNGGKWSCNNYLGAMHDSGFELYKNFELGGVSVPFYFYLLNGGYQYRDNNRAPSIMVTVEPEIGAVRFKASLSTGKYDGDYSNGFLKYLFGAAVDLGPFSARAEYAAGTWTKSIGGTEDAKPSGYYAKLFYRVASWCKLMLHYDYVNNNYTGFHYTAPGSEKFTTITPGVVISVSPSSAILFNFEIADWQQRDKFGMVGQEDLLKFKRTVVSWRTTF
jgi:hypothetical protein